jgi:hypothetical protein
VDNARKMIGKTVDIAVTSVLQTTAGKMIFGKFDERIAMRPEPPRSANVRPGQPQPSQPSQAAPAVAGERPGETA